MLVTNPRGSRRNARARTQDTLADMVESIRVLAFSRGCATEEDLLVEGFTAAEIAQHGEAAKARVRRLAHARAN